MSGAVIVGGGLAGQRCAETLRRSGYQDPIVMVCGEPHLPYDRPPLSKDVLLEGAAEQSLSFRSPGWYEEKAVELRLGVPAVALDARERRVHLGDGSCVTYEHLLIATGARPRRIRMFQGYENVTTLRTREDAARLRTALVPGARLLVIGAGFIGQEAASAARKAGLETTIIEAASAPLQSVLGSELGGWFADLHRANGTRLVLDRRVMAVRGEHRVDAVTLDDGRTLGCDHVLLGVGVDPDLRWLSSSALSSPIADRSGVRTDADGRTDIAGVYAAGDVAAAFEPLLERHVLGNHWESAGRQGARAAMAMLGLEQRPRGVSSFWSDLYGTRVHYLGHASLADEVTVDGDPQACEFTATFTTRERPVAVLLVGRPQMLPQARKLLSPTTEMAFA
jgi:3-phenylpropionate/trans-cinnamate dioxygenase ferredoxin reductase component